MAVEYDFPCSYTFRRFEAYLNGEDLPPITDPHQDELDRDMAEIDRRFKNMVFGAEEEAA